MRAAGIVATVFSAALVFGACGDDDDTTTTENTTETSASNETTETSETTASGGGGSTAGTAIVIKDFKFEPDKLEAKVGDKITVTNKDSATHTLTAKDKSVDTGNLAEGASGTITVAKAGTIDYVCEIHDFMAGSIEVE
ncbi:MAG TPA: cupredoxin domain-containing protein [Acidimicrobiales bacterium]|nr:cupredoxin domain-containing protein [Acidimicrobiales bacterium]